MTAPLSSHPADLASLVEDRERVLRGFLEREQDRLARACLDLARAFSRGGTLLAHGAGAAATDAAHVAVEFMHPVIVGKRALPALALPGDATAPSALRGLARGDDVALVITHGAPSDTARAVLAAAGERGLLRLALVGAVGEAPDADHVFVVASDDPQVVQEVQETAYHVLWELVHVFFEHPGLLAESCVTCGDVAVQATVVGVRGATATIEKDGAREQVAVELVEDVRVGDVLLCHAGVALEKLAPSPDAAPEEPDPTAFLYPFLEAGERDVDAVLADVRASTLRKGADVIALRERVDVAAVERCAEGIRSRLEAGGRVFAFGNGGSSTDAQDLAADLLAAGRPALALNDDVATLTAVANDVGYENVFARQLISLARAGDVAVAISTSGSSPNVLAGLEEASRRGLLTCAITGYDGGRLARLEWLDHLLAVPGDHVPRLQEVQATIYHLLVHAIGGGR